MGRAFRGEFADRALLYIRKISAIYTHKGKAETKQAPVGAWFAYRILVGLSRFELLTSAMSRQRSNQLSYSPEERVCILLMIFSNASIWVKNLLIQ